MHFAQRFIASLAVALVSCLPFSAEAAVGHTVGSATVTPIGSASYSIPIVVPPGINGMTPSLGLSYNSGTDNGALGVGWSIAGLSAIVRCPRTWAQDGESRDVRNDLSDRFCLDGNKLRLTSGTYGTSGATYRTELETFARITSYGSAGDGPAYFVVETKDGMIHKYGNSGDSRIESVGQTTARAWAINEVRDRSDNAITFTYTEDTTNGSFRVSSIDYASNAPQGVAATHSVAFVYETKPTNEIDSGYVAGSVIKEITRLDRVDVTYGATTLRRYELTYEGALSSTTKSRLASVQECAGTPLDCFPATTFSYQNGTSGLSANTNTGVSIPTTPWVLDVNGDGRTDLVYSSSATSGSGAWMVMLANTSGSYNTPTNTGVTNTNHAGAIPIDYNADGAEDLLVPYSGGTWWVMLGNASGLAAPVNTGAPATATGTGNNARAMDVNGDGLEDLVWADLIGWAGGDAIRYRVREWGGTFSSTATTLIGPMAVDSMITPNVFALDSRASLRRTQDFNGDGRGDFIYRHSRRVWEAEQNRYITTPQVTAHCIGAWSINATWLRGSAPLYFGDFNGDGKTDVMYRDVSGGHRVQFSTGTTLATNFLVSAPSVAVQAILDWDGDGYDDALARHTTNGTWHVIRSTGEGFAAPAATGLSAGTATYTVMDINGDGLPDLGNTVSGIWDYRLHSGATPDLLQTATDGFGTYTTFNYAPLLAASYTKYTDATYPAQDYQGSLPVVTSASASNGVGGSFTMYYGYSGARVNLQGRGFEGFYARRALDGRNSVYTYEYFTRTFPYTGTLFQIDTFQPNGTSLITRVQNTWNAHAYGSGHETASLPFVSASTVARYEVGGTYNGALVSTTSTTNLVDASTGTMYDTTRTTTEAVSGNGAQPGATYTQRIYSPTAYFTTSTANWCIGRPAHTQYINSHSQFGGGSITRTIDSTWDTVKCRVTQQVEEPSSTQWRVTTDIGYDNYGNVDSQTVTGIGMTSRSTTASYAATSGRLPQSVTNALSQTTQFSWNTATGTLASQTDPNGIVTSWYYDAFDRRVQEVRAANTPANSTSTTWQYADCVTYGCLPGGNNKMVVVATQLDTGGSFVTDQRIYTDRMDRPIAFSTRMLSGSYNRIDREYDALGRVYRESAPCWWSGCTQYWATSTYDLLNRATQTQRPVSDSDPTLQSTTRYYEGLTTRVLDALTKQSTYIGNAAGQLSRSIDHDGHYQNFDYDGFGNVLRVTDSANNTLQSNTYNVRGMRTAQTDMDMGSWTYTPNALGEIVSQLDAKSQTTTFGHDLLGRMTSRTELEGTNTFTFGTSANNHNIGRLVSMSGPGYTEGLTYDDVGRPLQRTITSDAAYQIDYAYNSIGALHTLTYPTSTSGYRLKLQYDYQNGSLKRVKDFNAPATEFWTANDTDPRGAVVDETLGNGIKTVRGFDAVTGLLDYIHSGPGGGSARQNFGYQWDRVGNLTQRFEANIAKTQDFQYDNLHRLDYWTLNGASGVDLAYDALGNITSRTYVGTYTYHATKKHAVITAGAKTYAYDNNGNVITRSGSPITWYSYNLPKLISGPSGNSSEFFYAPDRSRWKQVASYDGTSEQTIYVGGLVEKVTRGGVTSWKHYISGSGGAVAEYIRRSSGTNETVYLLKDHLGSVEMVTDASGNALSRLAFGGQGQRMNGTAWGGVPSSAEWATITDTTRRGFTSHEMLDNLNLTHMNGRVYDQLIGRFLSADPIVQAPAFTQSFNRYSYVFNNPLSFTDPSGFQTIETVVVTGSRGNDGGGGTGWSQGASGGVATTSANQNGPLPAELDQSIEEVQVYAARLKEFRAMMPEPNPSPSPNESTEDRNWACEAGNLLQTGAERGAEAGMAIQAAGVVVAAGGLVSGAEPVALVGGGMMATGGFVNLSASSMQTLGGLAQVAGGDSAMGWHNAGYGALNLAASLTPIGVSRYMMSAGRTVSQRVFNSQLQGGLAAAGAVSDTITFISPEAAPRQATCSE